jgi:prepilin-type processing-associated H-X9-DG protein/prepilin-type N-terminal cleavage/methylation domain-containing protein
MTRRPNSRSAPSSGFTLVELLVVIGIIALLISVLLPALNKARESARMVQCQSNIRQFFMADSFYMNRWKGWHLPGWTGGGTGTPNAFLSVPGLNGIDFWTSMEEFRKTTAQPWLDNNGPNAKAFRAYLVKERLCPEMVRGISDLHVADAASQWKDLYVDYSYGMNTDGVDYDPIKTAAPTPTSYGVFNPARAPQCDPALDGQPGRMSFHGFRNSQVRRPADKIFMADSMYFWINEGGSGVPAGTWSWKNKITNYDQTKETTHQNFPGGDTERTVAWRHKKTLANVCFFDGHVEGVSKDRFVTKDGGGNVIPNLQMWRVMD